MSSSNTPIKITWFLAGVTTYVLRTTVAFLQMYGGAVIIITAPSKSPLIVYASRYLQNTVKIGINTEIKVNIGFKKIKFHLTISILYLFLSIWSSGC